MLALDFIGAATVPTPPRAQWSAVPGGKPTRTAGASAPRSGSGAAALPCCGVANRWIGCCWTRRGAANRARSAATHRHRDDGDAIVPTLAV